MRLMNTSTLKLYEFFGDEIPYYATLSHRWEEEEVTFQDLQTEAPNLHEMRGWRKIRGSCAQANSDGWEYIWIDSCCIDKSSSAELSEAINSMFRWYQDSQVCYAYLCDVPTGQSENRHWETNSAFRNSVWFTRGWTLQELLAPDTVIFFDDEWCEIGTKSSLENLVASITGIDCLLNYNEACVAQKMSWASKRKTLRTEDMAYSLLGLFKVHMPLIYGEGANAFLRLQLEILKVSQDESIFAWTESIPYNTQRGLLARSPACFKHSGDVILGPNQRGSAYSMTNAGLQMDFHLFKSPEEDVIRRAEELKLRRANPYFQGYRELDVTELPSYMVPIFCFKRNNINRIVLELARLHPGDTSMARVNCERFLFHNRLNSAIDSPRTVFVKQIEIKPPRRKPIVAYVESPWFEGNDYQLLTSYGRHDCSPTPLLCPCVTVHNGPDLHEQPLLLMLATDTVFVVFMGNNRIFGLVVECSSDQGIGIALHQLSNNHRGKDMASNLVHSFKRLPPLKQLRDRATLNLPGNIVVSSSLKKKVYNARIQYTIEVKFGYLSTTHPDTPFRSHIEDTNML